MDPRTNRGMAIIAGFILAAFVALEAIVELVPRKPLTSEVDPWPISSDSGRAASVALATGPADEAAADRPTADPQLSTGTVGTCVGCGSGNQWWSWSSRVRCELCGAGHCAACVESTLREERLGHAGHRSEWTCQGCGYVITKTRWDAAM